MRRLLFSLPFIFLTGCSLDLRPTVLVRLNKSPARARARTPALAAMRFAISFSGNGTADTYGGSALRGRAASCLGLAGLVSKLYSIDEIEAGVSLPVPGGIYLTTVVGFYGVPETTATVPEAMALNSIEIYPIGSSVLDVSRGRASIVTTYPADNPENRFGACRDLTGGNTLTRIGLYTGFSGTQGGPAVAFNSAEGGFPPHNTDGTDMTSVLAAGWNAIFLYFAPQPNQNYFPRIDIKFAANTALLNQYRSLSVEVTAASYKTVMAGPGCGTATPQAPGRFEMQVFLGTAPVKSWTGTNSAPGSTRTLSAQPAIMGYLFTPDALRNSGGVVVSVRSQDHSSYQTSCGGLAVLSATATLIP